MARGTLAANRFLTFLLGVMSTSDHVLFVGGSGMLRAAALEFAKRGHIVSVVARRQYRMDEMAEHAANWPGSIHGIALDYRNTDTLTESLNRAIGAIGAIKLAVCWIHSTAHRAPFVVADVVGRGSAECRYFNILGSAAADPSLPDPEREAQFNEYPKLKYREIVLGFIEGEAGEPRWLTDEEISHGVLTAIDADEPRRIVGTVSPWESRP